MDDYGCKPNQWSDVVGRARLGRWNKAVALRLSSYAKADGTKIYPSIARLAVECELSYSTVRRALAALRNAGLIELVKAGNSRRNEADEYRLVLHPDVLERVEIPNPDQHKAAIRQLSEQNSGADRARRRRQSEDTITAHLESGNQPVDKSDPGPSSTAPQESGKNRDYRSESHPITALLDERPTTIENLPVPPAEPAMKPPVDPAGSNGSAPTRERARDDQRDSQGQQESTANDPKAEQRRQLAAIEALIAEEAAAAGGNSVPDPADDDPPKHDPPDDPEAEETYPPDIEAAS